MGRQSRRDTEANLRRMAKATVDMERGVYDWPDGRKPFKADGTPVIVKTELVRVAGYSSENKNSRNWDSWFNDPYYEKECRLERARRDMNLDDIIEKSENLALALADGLFRELLIRLQTDPQQFSTQQTLAMLPQLHKYGLELAAKQDTLDSPGQAPQLNTWIGPNLIEMNQNERDHFVATAQEAGTARFAVLQKQIDSLQVREEEPDADEPVTAERAEHS